VVSVYRVLSQNDWDDAQAARVVPLCGSDERDGFVHLSKLEDVVATANLYFDENEAPLVIEIDAIALGSALVWEEVASRDHKTFPHLYSPGIPMTAVRATHMLEHQTTGFALGPREAR
jgi:uncharacterized protein (DUF952 family)